MIKGCNKRVIVMKDTGHDMIEEAFFILKANSPSCKEKCYSEDDILKQANLILDEKGCTYPFGDVRYNVSALPRKNGSRTALLWISYTYRFPLQEYLA